MMKTAADRLKWFLEFAQLEWVSNLDPDDYLIETPKSTPTLKQLKEWEYLKLKDEVIEFIGGTDVSEPVRFGIKEKPVAFDKNGFPIWPQQSGRTLRDEIDEWLTKEKLAVLSVRSKGYLASYIRDEVVTETTGVSPTFRKDAAPVRKRVFVRKKNETISFLSPTVSFNMRTATWLIESSPAHLFFIRFGLVLMEEGTSQIQKCPECRRAFYRVRKQKYCSKTCINRVSRRQWLAKPKNKKKERQWARERYERRVRRRTNGKVKVQSRKKGGDIV
jgi:hypothetical protein